MNLFVKIGWNDAARALSAVCVVVVVVVGKAKGIAIPLLYGVGVRVGLFSGLSAYDDSAEDLDLWMLQLGMMMTGAGECGEIKVKKEICTGESPVALVMVLMVDGYFEV